MSRFIDHWAAHYADPGAAVAAFFPDAVAAAASVGALLESAPELDGQRYYLPTLTGKRDRKQFALGSIEQHKDGTSWPAITFKSYKGASIYWTPRDAAFREWQATRGAPVAVSDNARALARATADAAIAAAHAQAAERDREEQAGRAAAAAAAVAAWSASVPADDAHSYLVRKGVRSHGLRVASADVRAELLTADGWKALRAVRAGDLLVPVYDQAGTLMNLQRIDRDGRKLFLAGGAVQGGHFRIDGTSGRTVLAEGYATAATWAEVTGDAVVVAFSAGNLAPVASSCGAHLVAADNDPSGTGVRAAQATGLPYMAPPTVGMDWQDWAAANGRDVMVALLAIGVPVCRPADLVRRAANDDTNPDAAPVFTDLASLPRVELTGREAVWFNRLAKETDPLQVAAVAWAICRKRAVTVPVQTTVDALLDRIATAAGPALHRATVTAMARVLNRWTAIRRTRALGHVTIPADVLARHRHEVHASLPVLAGEDFRGVIVLWAPMGAGKTQLVGRPFADHARSTGGRFVAVTHRRSLVAELARRLACAHYGDVLRETAFAVDALATCLPSVTKKAHAQIFDEVEYLFIDEVAQVLRFLESNVACRTEDGTNADVYDRLRSMVQLARCVVVADAGADRRTVEFIEACRPGEQFRIIEVEPQDQGLTATVGYGADAVAAVYGEAAARIADGQRLMIACESERRVAEVAKLLEGVGARVLAVTASNRGNVEQSQFWADPEGVSREFDAVVHSPVISSGMSIEHCSLPHFDHGVFVGGGHAIAPGDAAQMMRRVRYLRTWSVAFVANSLRGQDDPESMLEGMSDAERVEGGDTATTEFDAFVAGIKADNNAARGDFAAGLLWQLERSGIAIKPLPDSVDAADADVVKELRDQLDVERRAAIKGAFDLTADQARTLRASEGRTQAQSDALVRHSIQQALGVDEVTDEALDVFDDGRGPRRLDRFAAAVYGTAERRDDGRNLSQRRFTKARVVAYRFLFGGTEVRPGLRVDDDMAEALVRRMIERRHLFVWLGIAPGRFGAAQRVGKDGKRAVFPMPKAPQKDVGELFRAMGLELKRRQNRHSGGQCYELSEAVFLKVKAWAERRGSHSSRVYVLSKNTPTVTVEYPTVVGRAWHAVRRELIRLQRSGALTVITGRSQILSELHRSGRSGHAWLTYRWWVEEIEPGLAA